MKVLLCLKKKKKSASIVDNSMTVSGLTCLGSRPSLCVEFPMNYSFLNPQLHDTRVFHFLDAVSIPQIGFTHWLTYVFFIFCLMFFFFFCVLFFKIGPRLCCTHNTPCCDKRTDSIQGVKYLPACQY